MENTHPRQSRGQLRHGFVEGDVLEELEPREEDAHSHCIVEVDLPVTEEFKVREGVGVSQQFFQLLTDGHGAKHAKTNTQKGYLGRTKEENYCIIPGHKKFFYRQFFPSNFSYQQFFPAIFLPAAIFPGNFFTSNIFPSNFVPATFFPEIFP